MEGSSHANLAKWANKTNDAMMKARDLTRVMLTKVRQNEIEEAANKSAAAAEANREKEAKRAVVYTKAKAHGVVINTAFKCMQDIHDAILQTEDSIIKLTHERYKGFAALQVCERRISLREGRPPAENFKDLLTEALDAEKRTLEGARKELENLEKVGKKIVHDLEAKNSFLSRDTGERRLAMSHDMATLRESMTPAPPSPTAGDASNSAHAENVVDEKASKVLIQETNNLLEKSRVHRNDTFALIARCKQDAWRVNLRTEDTLARRCGSLADMKRQLEKHVLDVEAAIQTAKNSLEKTKKRLDPNDKHRKEKLASDEKVLSDLEQTKLDLQDDIRNKFKALEIDNMCRRVTPAKAAESTKKVTRSGSVPNLTRKDQSADPLRPGSPLGSSMALKGAGSGVVAA